MTHSTTTQSARDARPTLTNGDRIVHNVCGNTVELHVSGTATVLTYVVEVRRSTELGPTVDGLTTVHGDETTARATARAISRALSAGLTPDQLADLRQIWAKTA